MSFIRRWTTRTVIKLLACRRKNGSTHLFIAIVGCGFLYFSYLLLTDIFLGVGVGGGGGLIQIMKMAQMENPDLVYKPDSVIMTQ